MEATNDRRNPVVVKERILATAPDESTSAIGAAVTELQTVPDTSQTSSACALFSTAIQKRNFNVMDLGRRSLGGATAAHKFSEFRSS